ncbi:MAG: hypothetical protein A2X51_08530 [Candidatus Rokubacteria bacterium GWC2_70_24]|nr:MAG: hypothetical protein A2X53_16115 [Candidatus Rokubacteria bacterium GWA2_70_23]OGK88278.1 MAG: hypothetical protein A2X51_08530 [Candidatus Rokubacteria bacterium GWC2_70_24]
MGFRYVVESEAARLNLEGWVRNRRDGAVEAVVAGSDETVTAMIEACGRGPPAAAVAAVDLREAGADDLALRVEGESFSVLHTA